MKILYGVQGTGNGHITRARGMVKHLANAGLETDFIFTGRPLNQFNDMEPFGNWRRLEGLTFSVNKGKINMLDTVFKLQPRQLLRDINELSLDQYDLVVSDFEPVTAWAAHTQRKKCLGIGHQYAFDFNIPKTGDSPLTRTIMKKFAPTTYSIGMHWHHFNQPIIPPIVDVCEEAVDTEKDMIIVYLPFEASESVVPLLTPIKGYRFIYYGAFPEVKVIDNVTMKPISRVGFQKDLSRCNGVISNSGFELASEAISLGKKIFTKPLQGQMEQLSNALAISKLKLGVAVQKITTPAISEWLATFQSQRVDYPDVAKHLCEWIASGELDNKQALIESLWNSTNAYDLSTFTPYPSQIKTTSFLRQSTG